MSGESGTLRSSKETLSDCMEELQKEQAVKKGEGSILRRGKPKKGKKGGEEGDRMSVVIFDIFIMITGMVPMICAKPSRMGESDRWQKDRRKRS